MPEAQVAEVKENSKRQLFWNAVHEFEGIIGGIGGTSAAYPFLTKYLQKYTTDILTDPKKTVCVDIKAIKRTLEKNGYREEVASTCIISTLDKTNTSFVNKNIFPSGKFDHPDKTSGKKSFSDILIEGEINEDFRVDYLLKASYKDGGVTYYGPNDVLVFSNTETFPIGEMSIGMYFHEKLLDDSTKSPYGEFKTYTSWYVLLQSFVYISRFTTAGIDPGYLTKNLIGDATKYSLGMMGVGAVKYVSSFSLYNAMGFVANKIKGKVIGRKPVNCPLVVQRAIVHVSMAIFIFVFVTIVDTMGLFGLDVVSAVKDYDANQGRIARSYAETSMVMSERFEPTRQLFGTAISLFREGRLTASGVVDILTGLFGTYNAIEFVPMHFLVDETDDTPVENVNGGLFSSDFTDLPKDTDPVFGYLLGQRFVQGAQDSRLRLALERFVDFYKTAQKKHIAGVDRTGIPKNDIEVITDILEPIPQTETGVQSALNDIKKNNDPGVIYKLFTNIFQSKTFVDNYYKTISQDNWLKLFYSLTLNVDALYEEFEKQKKEDGRNKPIDFLKSFRFPVPVGDDSVQFVGLTSEINVKSILRNDNTGDSALKKIKANNSYYQRALLKQKILFAGLEFLFLDYPRLMADMVAILPFASFLFPGWSYKYKCFTSNSIESLLDVPAYRWLWIKSVFPFSDLITVKQNSITSYILENAYFPSIFQNG